MCAYEVQARASFGRYLKPDVMMIEYVAQELQLLLEAKRAGRGDVLHHEMPGILNRRQLRLISMCGGASDPFELEERDREMARNAVSRE
jgi:hypothetical protein